MTAQIFALCVTAALALLVFFERKLLLSVSAIGIFFISHIVLLDVGLLATPWLLDSYLPLSFPYLHIEYLTDADVTKSITLVTGGTGLAVVGYRAAMAIGAKGKDERLGLFAPRYPIVGTGIQQKVLWSSLLICLTLVVLILVAELPTIRAAVAAGLQGESYYQARLALESHGRLFAYAALNVLPFLVACVAGSAWLKRKQIAMAYLAVGITTVVSILTFKKTYLMTELLALVAIWYVVKMNRRQWCTHETPIGLLVRGLRTKLPKRPVIVILIIAFAFVGGSYYLVAGGALSLPLAIGFAFERVFSRLTVMALIYAHYFPAIGGHYGLQNVGLLSDLFGTRLYEDTVVTVQYFDRIATEGGSGACGAIMDFYGAFGWSGWAILSTLLGALLYAVDRWMARVPPLLINRVLHVFLLLTVTYLAQASVFRTLSTYGGGVLVALWWLVGRQQKVLMASQQHEDAPVPGH